MSGLVTRVAFDPPLFYDGRQLHPHFIRRRFGLRGDAAVAGRGGCEVRGEALLDEEDREADAFILSRDMVHVLVELFDPDLRRAVLWQRLLVALAAARVDAMIPPEAPWRPRRSGDDLWVGPGKLSVSIATVSPVSALIHLGVNVDDRDTPVQTAALGPLGIDPEGFAEGLLADFAAEHAGVAVACSKVRPAHGEG